MAEVTSAFVEMVTHPYYFAGFVGGFVAAVAIVIIILKWHDDDNDK